MHFFCIDTQSTKKIPNPHKSNAIHSPKHIHAKPCIIYCMEMKRNMRRGMELTAVCLLLLLLFGTDNPKEPMKEYVLSEKEILGQEVEWELVQNFLPILGYLFHEQNGDNGYEQYVASWFPVYRYLTNQETLAKTAENREELAIGSELEKGLLEENANVSAKNKAMDGNVSEGNQSEELKNNDEESKEDTHAGEEGAGVAEDIENLELVQDIVDTSKIFLTSSDFTPVTEKKMEYDWESYGDMEKVRKEFFAIDATTEIEDERINPQELMEKDISLSEENGGPQILIYHTHSQETFADSNPTDSNTTIMGAGEYLANILHDTYGYEVLHHKGEYDVESRDYAYSNSLPNIEAILKEYPSIEVVIDLHRDAVAEDRKLVSQQNGKTAAQLMFFNGLSHTKKQGDISYLENPYIDDNLAFSFQMQVLCNEYYPGIARRIYLKGYRYNMHLCSKSLLVELGAQTNTCDEVKNTLDILAHVLSMCLSDEENR